MNMVMDYTQYTVEDFVMDSSFVEWVLQGPHAQNEFWESWIVDHPEKYEAIKEAIELVLLLNDYFHNNSTNQ